MTTFALQTVAKNPSTSAIARMASIDSWRINVPDERWLIESVVADALEGRGGTVFTINLDHLAKLRTDPVFRAVYERATYVTADGMPVVMLARSEGVAIERVTGADLVLPLCRAATEAGVPVHFFGTRSDVLERAVARLRLDVPGLLVAGTDAPTMGFDPCGEAATAAAGRIAASGARICFVALGAPKQELFADAAASTTEGVIYLGVGAALDFIAGERRRAPRLLQRLGFEWLWRTIQEPRRMMPRYLKSAVWLVGYLVRLVLGTARNTAVTVEIGADPRIPRPASAAEADEKVSR